MLIKFAHESTCRAAQRRARNPPDRFVLRECSRTVHPVSLVTHMHWSEGWRILRFEDGWREVGRRELELGPKPRIAAHSQFRICLRDPAARCARGFAESSAHRGRGERRMPVAPAASCALGSGRNAHEYTSTPESPDVPARNGFNGFLRALPGDRAVLPPSPADMFCLSPVGPTRLRKLDASVGASGPHDFAVRCNISRPLAW